MWIRAVLLMAALAGCSSKDSGVSGDSGVSSDMSISGGGDDLTGTQTIEASIGPIAVPAGTERTVCSTFLLGNTTALDVVQIDATLLPGSHHLIFYESTATTEAKDPVDCQPLDLSNGKPIYIAETQGGNLLNFPTGVAYHLAANQMIRIEAHYLNATPNAIMGMGTVRLVGGPPASYQAADIMFCGSVTKLVSPGVPPGMSMLQPDFYQVPSGIKVFGLTTHQHLRGTLMTVDKSSSTAAGTNLIMGKPYDNPPLVLFNDANLVSFAPGEGLRWQCSYDNLDSMTYTFGESAQSNEMCFLWAYYFPSVGHFLAQQDCWK
ncbi:MAG TPA: hypothetical protein VGL86_23625 [Polyangia bacterium]